MYNYWSGNPATYMYSGLTAGWLGFLLFPLIVWSLFWKGWALWRAAKNDSKVWFIVLLLVNTLGILDILYIFFFSKNTKRSSRRR
jgi:methionyl-tRNA synthetase